MTNDIQKIRELTGAGVMDCKKALEESGNDFDKALAIIKERGIAKIESKKERVAGSGIIETYVHNERVGVMLIICSETDFVSRSDDFKKLAHEIAMHIAAMNPENLEELLKQPYVKDESLTVDEFIKSSVAKFGENVQVAKFIRYEL